jgi:hypothetical protein
MASLEFGDDHSGFSRLNIFLPRLMTAVVSKTEWNVLSWVFHKAPCPSTLTALVLITTELYSIKIIKNVLKKVTEKCNLTVLSGGLITAAHWAGAENTCQLLCFP